MIMGDNVLFMGIFDCLKRLNRYGEMAFVSSICTEYLIIS